MWLALPDGAPSKVASCASEGRLAVFAVVHNVDRISLGIDPYSGNSGSLRAFLLALVAAGDDAERAKLQRTLAVFLESCRITICAVRRGPSLPARNTLSSSSTLSSSASKVQTSRFGSTSMTPRASDNRLAFTAGCRWKRIA